MFKRLATVGLIASAVIACEQENQSLPFETDDDSPVTNTIDAATGGTVTNASGSSGISVEFPAGAVSGDTDVTVSRLDGTDLGGVVAGTVLEGTTFAIEPAGLALDAPALLSLRVDAGSLSADDQLALDGVSVVDGAERDLTTTSIDLTSGILKARIDRLGNVGARIADDLLTIRQGTPGEGMTGGSFAVAPADAGPSTAGLLVDTTTWVADCEGRACLDIFDVLTEGDLLERYAGVVGGINLVGSGSLTFVGDDSGTVTGALAAEWELRVRTAGTVAVAPQSMAVDASGSLPYEIRDNRIYFGAWGLPYRIETEGDQRYLILEMPTTTVTLRTGDAERTVEVAARLRLAEVD